VTELQKLDRALADLGSRNLMFCDEALAGDASALPDISGPWAILIGPEGGFSDRERARLRGMDLAHAVSLGPRILRADTATVAALTLWQMTIGDWQ
jgi:16S rRNA (uracil1498-N3)-methyltransferase